MYKFTGTNDPGNLNTLTMVFILVGVVKGVFICFAVVAVCYRYSRFEKKLYILKEVSYKKLWNSQWPVMFAQNVYLGFRSHKIFFKAISG